MEYFSRRGFRASALTFQVFILLILAGLAHSQGLRSSPYGAPFLPRGLSDQGVRQGDSDTVSISSGMLPSILPSIPNLQVGYLYNFGPNVRSGRFTADYLLPFDLTGASTVFGEAHTEFQSFWNAGGFNNRVDISLGGGYRTLLRRDTLLGVNGFYDTSRLGGAWYSSGGVGFELAAIIAGNDAIDLNFNWYGEIFNSTVIRNAFRYGPSNFDFQAGYSHETWNGGPDLRLSATGYKFDAGSSVYGWNAQAELKSRDGMLALRYNVGHDRINRTYQTVGGFVNLGFQLENLLKGESPFTSPAPIFRSPRNSPIILTQPVNRNWHQPGAAVVSRGEDRAGGPCPDGYYRVAVSGPVGTNVLYPIPGLPSLPTTTDATLYIRWSGIEWVTDDSPQDSVYVGDGNRYFGAHYEHHIFTVGDGNITIWLDRSGDSVEQGLRLDLDGEMPLARLSPSGFICVRVEPR